MKLCPLCESEFGDDVARCPDDNEHLVFISPKEGTLLGTTIAGRYEILGKIGEGGMGSVYAGVQQPVGRKVAIKVLRRELANDAEAVRRFFNEARVVSRLRHPNTVTLYDFGQSEQGDLYIVMEHLSGTALDELMAETSLTLPEVLEIADQVCQSLQEAHALGIVHRDLKPDNIFIDRMGGRNLVKVLDFGIAKVPDSGDPLTRTGMVFGTPAYMSPEQAQGQRIDHRCDIYTLGILLYEMLAGEPPFTAEKPMQIALKHVTTKPKSIMDMSRVRPLPLGLSALIMDMLEKRPSKRPATVAQVRERLLRVARQEPGLEVDDESNANASVRVTSSTLDTMPEAWKKADTVPADSDVTQIDLSPEVKEALRERANVREAEGAGQTADVIRMGGLGKGRRVYLRAGAAIAVLAAAAALAVGMVAEQDNAGAAWAGEDAARLPIPVESLLTQAAPSTTVDLALTVPAPEVVAAPPAPVEPVAEAMEPVPTPVERRAQRRRDEPERVAASSDRGPDAPPTTTQRPTETGGGDTPAATEPATEATGVQTVEEEEGDTASGAEPAHGARSRPRVELQPAITIPARTE